MLERRSALAKAPPYRSDILQIGEAPGFCVVQVAGFGKAFDKALVPVLGKLPKDMRTAVESGRRILMRTGPSQIWIVGPENDDIAAKIQSLALITPLSHSRTRIVLEGAPARDVLAKGIPLDFHSAAFTQGQFAMSGLHHTPVLIHCTAENRFEIYALRTFAASVWEWLCDAALEFAAQ